MTAISLEASKTWHMTQVAHINGGPKWFGYKYMCVEQPRLYRLDRYERKARSVTSTFSVDGKDCANLTEAIAALASPPVVDDAERELLARFSEEWAAKDDWKNFASYVDAYPLTQKGLLVWSHGQVRLTPLGAEFAKARADAK
jgi:hypothetical protein